MKEKLISEYTKNGIIVRVYIQEEQLDAKIGPQEQERQAAWEKLKDWLKEIRPQIEDETGGFIDSAWKICVGKKAVDEVLRTILFKTTTREMFTWLADEDKIETQVQGGVQRYTLTKNNCRGEKKGRAVVFNLRYPAVKGELVER